MIGVTGATGQVGGRLAARLEARGVPRRLIARDPARLWAGTGAGSRAAAFGGYGDPDGMRAAFAGVSTLFLCSAGESEDRPALHRAAVDAAVAAGVERIVYLSFIGAAADATFTFARQHFDTEEHLRRSGIAWTCSRQSLYADLLPLIPGPDDVIRGPAADGRLAPVARDDVADALVEMLTGTGHDGATYTLTGPEALTLSELAAEVARATGRDVRYVDETLEEAHASRADYGAPAWEVEGWITTYTAIAAGEMELVTDDVLRLTGHPPRSVRELLEAQATGAHG